MTPVRLTASRTIDGAWSVASGRRLSISALADIVEHSSGVELSRVHRPIRNADVHDAPESAAASPGVAAIRPDLASDTRVL
jgi:hypothetical protein